MAGMAWLATTPRSSFGCCGPAIAELPLPPPSPVPAATLPRLAGRPETSRSCAWSGSWSGA